MDGMAKDCKHGWEALEGDQFDLTSDGDKKKTGFVSLGLIRHFCVLTFLSFEYKNKTVNP